MHPNQYSAYHQTPQYDNYTPGNYNNNSEYYQQDVNNYNDYYTESYYNYSSYSNNNVPNEPNVHYSQGSGSFDQQHEYYQQDPTYAQQNYYNGEYLGGSQTEISGNNCYYYGDVARDVNQYGRGNNEQTYDSYDYRREFDLRNCE